MQIFEAALSGHRAAGCRRLPEIVRGITRDHCIEKVALLSIGCNKFGERMHGPFAAKGIDALGANQIPIVI